LLFVLLAFGALVARALWEGTPSLAPALWLAVRSPWNARCAQPPLTRRSAEQAQLILQCRSESSFIARVALQDPKPTYDAPIHLREPHLPPENSVVLGALAVGIMLVCSSKRETGFSLAESCSPSNTLRRVSAKWLAPETWRSGRSQKRSWVLRATLLAGFAPARPALCCIWLLRPTSAKAPCSWPALALCAGAPSVRSCALGAWRCGRGP
jgi:hypothetical protein